MAHANLSARLKVWCRLYPFTKRARASGVPQACCTTNRRWRPDRRAIALASALMVPLGACDSLLDVKAPSRVPAEDLESPAAAALLVQSAVGDFDCALASYITTTSQVVDEFMGVHIYSAEAFDYDRRTVDPARQQYATRECGEYGAIYQPLSTAIWQADNVLADLEGYTDEEVTDRARLMQTAAAYAGYGRVLLGEGFCTAAIDTGPELTSQEIFDDAEALFTRALDRKSVV